MKRSFSNFWPVIFPQNFLNGQESQCQVFRSLLWQSTLMAPCFSIEHYHPLPSNRHEMFQSVRNSWHFIIRPKLFLTPNSSPFQPFHPPTPLQPLHGTLHVTPTNFWVTPDRNLDATPKNPRIHRFGLAPLQSHTTASMRFTSNNLRNQTYPNIVLGVRVDWFFLLFYICVHVFL